MGEAHQGDWAKPQSVTSNQATTRSRTPSPAPSAFAAFRSSVPSRQAIALICDHGDPDAAIGKEEADGQNVYVRQVGEALVKLGWQVDLFTPKTNPADATIVHHGSHFRTVRLGVGSPGFIPREQLWQYMPQFVQSFQAFQQKEGFHYPLIHTNYWLSAWMGLQLRQSSNVQLVHTYHSLGAVQYQGVHQRPAIAAQRLAVEQQILETADCVVATSPQEREMLRNLVSLQGKIEVVPCGTDLETFRTIPQLEARHSLGFAPQEKIVLYVGRFDPRKGIETLVQACARLRQDHPETLAEVRLVIVGGSDPEQIDGQERDRIAQLVQDLGLGDRTCFAGQIGHDRLPLYYAAADVCVIPSHYEPFGLVALEAMACGTPVVASAVGGLKFTVMPEETGILVPAQDAAAFAEAIYRVLTDNPWTQKIRRQASLRVQQNFSWAETAVQLSHLYRQLLAQSLLGSPSPTSGTEGSALLPTIGRSPQFPMERLTG